MYDNVDRPKQPDTPGSLPIRPVPPAETCPIHRVLNIPELLELVLLHLSQSDLLLSQRTSVAFRRTVQASPRLQKALFLAPDWPRDSIGASRPGRKPDNNRLIMRAFPSGYPTVILEIHPEGDGIHEDLDNVQRWSWKVCISFPADRPPNTSPAVLYPDASWRKMFLSQPPCTSLYLVRRWQQSQKPAIVRKDGITMGEFAEEATKTSCQWHRSYISSDNDWHFEGKIKSSRSQRD